MFSGIRSTRRQVAVAGLLVLLGAGGQGDASSGPSKPDRESDPVQRVRAAVLRENGGDTTGVRAIYLRAADELPTIADWLLLRAGGLTRDSMARQVLYARIRSPTVLPQILVTEARIRENLGDIDGAVRARWALGDTAAAIRLRLGAAGDVASRSAMLDTSLAWLGRSSGVRAAGLVTVLSPYAAQMTPAGQLQLARAAAATQSPTTSGLYEAVAATGASLTERDRLAWGTALLARGESAAAETQFGLVTQGPLVTQALWLRGRTLVRMGQTQEGRDLLDRVVRISPKGAPAGHASLLLGDLSRDAGNYTIARTHWLQAAVVIPGSTESLHARFLAALVLWQQQKYSGAAKEWDSLRVDAPTSEDGIAAAYWAGRAWERIGQPERAAVAWGALARSFPLSYYADLSLRRLGRTRPAFAARFDGVVEPADVVATGQRMSLLAQASLGRELRLEQEWAANRVGSSVPRMLAVGNLLVHTGAAVQATEVGWRAWRQGGPTREAASLIFPLLHPDPLTTVSRANLVDPMLVAALIRQESVFDSAAVSRAGARGLMQIMPVLAQHMAQARGITPWHADSLYSPSRNLELGTAYLAELLHTHQGLEQSLAAYNAGSSRVTRWLQAPGTKDPESFVEWIPFTETRNYVKTVLRNLELYRALYE